jgi:hypothetical protein
MRRYRYVNIVCTSTDFDVKLDLAPIRKGYISDVFTAIKLCSVKFGMATCSLLAGLSVVR